MGTRLCRLLVRPDRGQIRGHFFGWPRGLAVLDAAVLRQRAEPLPLERSVLVADRLVPVAPTTSRATFLAPAIVAVVAHVWSFGGFRANLPFSLYSGALAAGVVVVLAALIEARRTGWAIVPLLAAITWFPNIPIRPAVFGFLVGMGCYMETAHVTVAYLREKGVLAGCLNVTCFRPFPMRQIVEALRDCTAFSVLERMDDPLSTTGNHLTREVKAAFCDAAGGAWLTACSIAGVCSNPAYTYSGACAAGGGLRVVQRRLDLLHGPGAPFGRARGRCGIFDRASAPGSARA